jgi:GH24 family phage-related lysozyme (muramidase)
MNLEAVKARLRLHEGSIPHMYKCTGDKVTIGVGHAIDDAEAACQLPWTVNGAPAGAGTVQADFARVEAQDKGRVASTYASLTTCRLSNAEIDKLMERDIPVYEAQARKIVPDYDRLPGPAQEALFDMVFNLGPEGLRKFKNLLAAVAARDWERAALESHRRGIPDARNQDIARLFRQAGSAGAVAP